MHVTAVAGAAAVVTFLVALAVAQHDVRERSLAARAVASRRRVRTVARSLERLAALAERGAAEPRQTRPPRSVLELAPEAAAIRELATLLRAHPAAARRRRSRPVIASSSMPGTPACAAWITSCCAASSAASASS